MIRDFINNFVIPLALIIVAICFIVSGFSNLKKQKKEYEQKEDFVIEILRK